MTFFIIEEESPVIVSFSFDKKREDCVLKKEKYTSKWRHRMTVTKTESCSLRVMQSHEWIRAVKESEEQISSLDYNDKERVAEHGSDDDRDDDKDDTGKKKSLDDNREEMSFLSSLSFPSGNVITRPRDSSRPILLSSLHRTYRMYQLCCSFRKMGTCHATIVHHKDKSNRSCPLVLHWRRNSVSDHFAVLRSISSFHVGLQSFAILCLEFFDWFRECPSQNVDRGSWCSLTFIFFYETTTSSFRRHQR